LAALTGVAARRRKAAMPITATFTRDSVLIMFALSCNDFAFTETRLIVTAIHSRNEVTSQRCHRRRSEIASMSRDQNVAAVVVPHNDAKTQDVKRIGDFTLAKENLATWDEHPLELSVDCGE
jgi:hypothetical protein